MRFKVDKDISIVLELPDGFETTEGYKTFVESTGIMAGALATMRQKDRLYGAAWREQGWMGNLARIMSKTARLRAMLWRPDDVDSLSEPVVDTLQDLINLCVFMTLNRRAGNKWGRS